MPTEYKKRNLIAVKLPMLIVLGMLITLALVAQITYQKFEKEMIEQSTQLGMGATGLMSEIFPAEYLDEFLEKGFESEKYNEVIKEFYGIKNNYPNIKYMYVWVCTDEGGIVVMDLDEEYTNPPLQESVEAIGTVYEYTGPFKEKVEALTTGSEGTLIDPFYEDNEYVLTVITPVFDEDGNYACSVAVDMSMDAIRQNNQRFIFSIMGIAVLIMIPIWAYIMFVIYKDMLNPIEKMVKCILHLKRDSEQDRYAGLSNFENLNISTKNEVEILYRASMVIAKENLFNMSNYTKSKDEIQEISEVAYKDALTRVGSKKAYDNQIQKIEKMIAKDKSYQFGVVMVDANNLKKINDVYGHEKGDIYIRGVCKIICKVFEHSPVYRIGGDEFVVYLNGDDFERRAELYSRAKNCFTEAFEDESKEEYERFSASMGLAVYDNNSDKEYNDVFTRADKLMYMEKDEHKKKYGKYR